MSRVELINEIIDKAKDEFETKDDFIKLAYMNDNELVNNLIHINNHILEN